MAPDTGRHDADENAVDRARIDYLAGDVDLSVGIDLPLGEADRAELDELRELLADPTLWAEPPAELEDAVVTAIVAEAAALPPLDEVRVADSSAAPAADGAVAAAAAAPIDLSAARRRRAERAERTGRRGWTRPTLLLAAAAAAIVLLVGGVVALNQTSQRTFDASMQPTDLAPNASGSAVMIKTDSGWKIELNVTGLPRLDNGRFYQGWLRNADGVLVPIGTFNEGTDVVLWSGVSPDAFPTITVTEEQADGNQASSGQRVLTGTAVEVK